jgi:hypothetical protein
MSIQSFLNDCPSAVSIYDHETVVIQWSTPGIGFGEYTFHYIDGLLHLDSERMSKNAVKEVLCRMVDEAIID